MRQFSKEEAGAPAERTLVIPNGIDLDLYEGTRRKRRRSGKYHIGLVGRVVPIKDIKTFLQAGKIVADRLGASKVEISVIDEAMGFPGGGWQIRFFREGPSGAPQFLSVDELIRRRDRGQD